MAKEVFTPGKVVVHTVEVFGVTARLVVEQLSDKGGHPLVTLANVVLQEEELLTRVVTPLAVPVGIPLIVTMVGTEVIVLGVTVYPLALVILTEEAVPNVVTL